MKNDPAFPKMTRLNPHYEYDADVPVYTPEYSSGGTAWSGSAIGRSTTAAQELARVSIESANALIAELKKEEK